MPRAAAMKCALIDGIDVARLLDEGRRHDLAMAEARPPLAEAGVGHGAHGDKAHGVGIIEVADEPRARSHGPCQLVEFVQFLVGEGIGLPAPRVTLARSLTGENADSIGCVVRKRLRTCPPSRSAGSRLQWPRHSWESPHQTRGPSRRFGGGIAAVWSAP